MHNHHLLPREFEWYFKQAELEINDYVIQLSEGRHILKPEGIHTITGGNWNAQWAAFIANNPTPNAVEILKYMEILKREFGI